MFTFLHVFFKNETETSTRLGNGMSGTSMSVREKQKSLQQYFGQTPVARYANNWEPLHHKSLLLLLSSSFTAWRQSTFIFPTQKQRWSCVHVQRNGSGAGRARRFSFPGAAHVWRLLQQLFADHARHGWNYNDKRYDEWETTRTVRFFVTPKSIVPKNPHERSSISTRG